MGLSTCDKKNPSVLWCKLIKQAQDTLYMLRTSRTHPQLSYYHVLEGPHDFNQAPFAPPGCCTTIFNPPETCTSWVPRSIDAWYCSPAYEQYRAWKLHIHSTGVFRTSAQATLYPQYFTMPTETPMYKAARIETTLIRAIQKIRKENQTFQGRHGESSQQIANIFGTTADNVAPTPTTTNQTSTTPTTPYQIRTTPRTHQHVTQENKPGIITITPTTTSDNSPKNPSEGVIVPTSEGERDNTPPTSPPWRSKRIIATVRQPIKPPQNQTPSDVSPPNHTTPNYITQEALNAISVPTHTATTMLQHLCAPVMHPITGESITNYKNWQKIQQQGNSGRRHLERNGETLCNDIKNSNEREKLAFCPRSEQNTKYPWQPKGNIFKHRCILPSTKEIPQLRPDHGQQQPHRLPHRNHNKNCRSHKIKNITEKHH